MKKFDRTRQDTGSNKIRYARIICWTNKATDTYSEYVIHAVFHGNNGYAEDPQYYVYTYIARLV